MTGRFTPPVPVGTLVPYDPRTYARPSLVVPEAYVPPVHPPPPVPAYDVRVRECTVTSARTFAGLLAGRGWAVRVRRAVGYDLDTETGTPAGTPIWEPTGELTPNGVPARRQVGRTINDPVESFAVIGAAGGRFWVCGLWIDRSWGFGWAVDRENSRLRHLKIHAELISVVNEFAPGTGNTLF